MPTEFSECGASAECRHFEKVLAFHTAPSLLGIKCASLVSLSKDEFDIDGYTRRFNRRAAARGLKIKVLCSRCGRCCSESGEKSLMLVYNEDKLAKRLCSDEVRQLLREYGYTDDMTPEQCIERLSQRMGGSEFPHEIGVFLDYPVEDVRGFVQNGGCNYKLCGCWKVYGSVESARRKFAAYDRCREYLCGKLEQGEDIYHALKIS